MSWQELLWSLPTELGWRWYAIWGAVALVAAVIMFFTMIMHQEFSALLVARVLLGVGLLLIPLCTLQPGYQPWVPVFYSTGGLLTAVLIATRWCEREDKGRTVGRALWRWAVGRVAGAATWLAGHREHNARREDAL